LKFICPRKTSYSDTSVAEQSEAELLGTVALDETVVPASIEEILNDEIGNKLKKAVETHVCGIT
jgi:hypothetical protein